MSRGSTVQQLEREAASSVSLSLKLIDIDVALHEGSLDVSPLSTRSQKSAVTALLGEFEVPLAKHLLPRHSGFVYCAQEA